MSTIGELTVPATEFALWHALEETDDLDIETGGVVKEVIDVGEPPDCE